MDYMATEARRVYSLVPDCEVILVPAEADLQVVVLSDDLKD